MEGVKVFSKILNKLSKVSQRQLMMLAGIVGIIMFTLIYVTLHSVAGSKEDEEQTNQVQIAMTKIVVAAKDIPTRTIIKDDMLKFKEVPKDMVPSGAITDTSKILEKATRIDIMADDVLTEKKIFQRVEDMGFIGLIPPNCRAVSISTSDITGVSGFAKPGDRVDVMLVSDKGTEILLQNVLLLATGTQAIKNESGVIAGVASAVASSVTSQVSAISPDSKGASSTATLALTVDEAMKLVSDAKRGTLYLILRPYRPLDPFVANTYYEAPEPIQSSKNSSLPFNMPSPVVEAPVPSNNSSNSANRPAPAFQPPASPVVNSSGQNTFRPPSSSSYGKPIEIIQGDKVSQE